MPLTKRERSIASKFKRYERLKEKASKYYDQADTVLSEIARAMSRNRMSFKHETKSGTVSTRYSTRIGEDGLELHCIDNAAGYDVILGWGHAAVRRYELKTVNP
jgi:hypothetical protein